MFRTVLAQILNRSCPGELVTMLKGIGFLWELVPIYEFFKRTHTLENYIFSCYLACRYIVSSNFMLTRSVILWISIYLLIKLTRIVMCHFMNIDVFIYSVDKKCHFMNINSSLKSVPEGLSKKEVVTLVEDVRLSSFENEIQLLDCWSLYCCWLTAAAAPSFVKMLSDPMFLPLMWIFRLRQ